MKNPKFLLLALTLFAAPATGFSMGVGPHIAAELLLLGVSQITAAPACCSDRCQKDEIAKVERLEVALRYEQGKAETAKSESARSFHQSVINVLTSRISAIKGGKVYQGKAVRFICG